MASNSRDRDLSVVPVALIATGLVTGAGGLVLGLKGAFDIRRANKRIQAAGARYEHERRGLEVHELVTNESLKALGFRQEQANELVVQRMIAFLRRHQKQVSESEKLLADGLESAPGSVEIESGLGQDALSWMRGVLGSAAAGIGVNAGVTAAVTSFAAASTGTAISTLSGAAATNATLAFLGGGSLASGGGGMAVGAAALNFVTIGPAILVSGLVVAGQGEKAKTKARENEYLINVAIAKDHETRAKFDVIIARAKELGDLLDGLAERGQGALDLLEAEPFDPSNHAVRFQQALTLTQAVREVAAAQVVGESGNVNEEAATLWVRYRTLSKGEADA